MCLLRLHARVHEVTMRGHAVAESTALQTNASCATV